ncbi:MAG: hypothetical protein U0174_06090 [Polyangiaceae bacterium]
MAWRGVVPSENPAASLPTTVYLTGTKSFVVDRVIHDGARSLVLSAFAEYPFGLLRNVALKFGRGGGGPARLKREAMAYSRVRHPSLAHLIEYGVDSDGQHVLVFDLYEGVSLATWLRKLHDRDVGIPKPVAVLLALRVFEALHALHLARDPMTNEFSPIVHGNVTPENLFLSLDGTVRLHDLGSATSLARETLLTKPPGASHLFEALELEETVHGNVRSDVHAGCRLFHGLLRRSSSDVAETIPASFAASGILSARLASALERGLHPETELRNLSAGDMVAALRAEGCSDIGQRYLQELLKVHATDMSSSLLRPSGVVARRPAVSIAPDAFAGERQQADTITPPPQSGNKRAVHLEVAMAKGKDERPSSIPTTTGAIPLSLPIPRLAPPPSFDAPSPLPDTVREAPLTKRDFPPLLEAPLSPPAPPIPPAAPESTPPAAIVMPAAAPTEVRDSARPPAQAAPSPFAYSEPPRPYEHASIYASSVPPPLAFAPRDSLPSYSSVKNLDGERTAKPKRSRLVALTVAAALTALALGGVVWVGDHARDISFASASGAAQPPREPSKKSAAVGMTAILRSHEAPVAPSLPGIGYVRTDPSERGHRIFVDGNLAGGGGGSLPVSCGFHTIRVGSTGVLRDVRVPCNDEVYVSR